MNISIEIYVFITWLLVACILESHAYYIKKYQTWKWRRRQEGLLSFSNKEFLIMRWLWPITLMFSIFIFFTILLVSKVVEIYKGD